MSRSTHRRRTEIALLVARAPAGIAYAWACALLLLAMSVVAAGQGGGLTGPPTVIPGPARRVPPPDQQGVTPLPPPRPTP